MAPSATIELYIDGVRVPSTPGELAGGVVTVLDSLRLTWGRDGQHEQPGPASVVCELVDPAGADDVLDVVHVGSTVAIWAEGSYAPPAGGLSETYDDPTLNSFPLGDAVASRYAGQANSTTAVVMDVAGARVIELRGVTPMSDTWAPYVRVTVPPRQFSPTGELPNAWDDIPRWARADPSWQASLRVKAPAGAVMALALKFFTAPYVGSQSAGSSTANTTMTGDWQTVSVSVPKSAAFPNGTWLAVAVEMSGLKPRWKDQPPTLTWAEATGTWDEFCRVLVDTTSVLRPAATAITRRVLVFSGEISDLRMSPWGDRVSTGLTVTAVDIGGRLGNTVVGDEPWPVHTVAVRADRIAQLAGITTVPRVRIDTGLDVLQVSARDVDAQPAYPLLQDLAQSAGGVLWAATHAVTGAFLWIENPANRAAVQQLVETGGIITITGGATGGVSVLSACDLLEDGVTWAQDTGDVATVVAVTWAEQGVDDDGQPTVTDRTVTVSADAATITRYGTRRLSISTELIAEADAAGYANRVLAQARAVAWRLDGLTLDTGAGLADTLASVDDASRQTALLDLLDGTTRMGAALTLVDMPAYAPRGAISSVYVDGGTYAYTGDAWVLSLATTPAAGQGSSVTWAEIDPAWRWNQWSPGIAWQDLYGVAA